LLLVASLLLASSTAAAAPPNDECTAATVIKSLPFSRTLAVDDATEGANDPSTCIGSNPTVWFVYTARADVSLDLDTARSSHDTGLAVHSGTCDALAAIACNENTPTSERARTLVSLRKGETIRIAVTSERNEPSKSLVFTARKSNPRYVPGGEVTALLRSFDASAYGGSQGRLLATVAQTTKLTAFAQHTDGIVADVGGTVTSIAHSGSPAPGGGTFATFDPPAASTTGIYFTALVENPVRSGLFRWDGSTLAGHLQAGDPGPAGTLLRSFTDVAAAGASGTVAFLGRTAGDTKNKLMRFDGTTVTLLAAQGGATPCGGVYRAFRSIAIDDAGAKVAFVATLQSGDATHGLFLTDGATVTAIACEDEPTPLGGTYRSIGDRPAINDFGEVYFASTNRNGPPETIWVHAAGVTTAVVSENMVLATGDGVSALGIDQELATDAAGTLVFVARLSSKGRALVRRAHLAALPSTILQEGDDCPLGGTFVRLDDELDLSATGELVFEAECDGGHGLFRMAPGEDPTVLASLATPTAIGTGVSMGAPAIDSTGTRVAARAGRTSLQSLTCTAKGCTAPAAVARMGSPIDGLPGQFLASLDPMSLGGDATTLAFHGTTAGVADRSGVLRVTDGVLTAVASSGDPLPGGVGTFGDLSGYLAVGKGVIAFTAAVEHPEADHGLFAATADGLVAVAFPGDPAPRGEIFTDFGVPAVVGRSLVFLAETAGPICIFGTKAVGKKITAIVCEEDPAPAPLAGIIGDFLTRPAGGPSDFAVVARTYSDVGSVACLLRFRNGKGSIVRCEDDPFPRGGFYASFDPLGFETSITADSTGKRFAFLAGDDATGVATLIALDGRSFVPLLAGDEITPIGADGGFVSGIVDFDSGLTSDGVVAAVDVGLGPMVSAIVSAPLP
jgi:hypothetical protein